jgi:hypothetical protein
MSLVKSSRIFTTVRFEPNTAACFRNSAIASFTSVIEARSLSCRWRGCALFQSVA